MKPTGFLRFTGRVFRRPIFENDGNTSKYPQKDRVKRRMMKRGEKNNFKEFLKTCLYPAEV
jgi:hypothetical protein